MCEVLSIYPLQPSGDNSAPCVVMSSEDFLDDGTPIRLKITIDGRQVLLHVLLGLSLLLGSSVVAWSVSPNSSTIYVELISQMFPCVVFFVLTHTYACTCTQEHTHTHTCTCTHTHKHTHTHTHHTTHTHTHMYMSHYVHCTHVILVLDDQGQVWCASLSKGSHTIVSTPPLHNNIHNL